MDRAPCVRLVTVSCICHAGCCRTATARAGRASVAWGRAGLSHEWHGGRPTPSRMARGSLVRGDRKIARVAVRSLVAVLRIRDAGALGLVLEGVGADPLVVAQPHPCARATHLNHRNTGAVREQVLRGAAVACLRSLERVQRARVTSTSSLLKGQRNQDGTGAKRRAAGKRGLHSGAMKHVSVASSAGSSHSHHSPVSSFCLTTLRAAVDGHSACGGGRSLSVSRVAEMGREINRQSARCVTVSRFRNILDCVVINAHARIARLLRLGDDGSRPASHDGPHTEHQ